ncbi:hypothetical protein [Nocardia sp. NPDC058633]|uniref:hypothetical protein n=1 Tax=Nocardia sp. NPDC058633 TaxID=3346568 RepID=UPI00365FEB4C
MTSENRARRLLDAYQALRKVLLTVLALPIELPELGGGQFRAGDSKRAVEHARSILRDMPADWHRRELVDQLALEWLEAVIMTKLAETRDGSTYGDIADSALTRFAATLEVIRYDEEL